jgi:hypothetical protein
MNLVEFNQDKHYGKLQEVWSHYGWPSCPVSFLPKTGLVAERADGTFIAALFMYIFPGSLAMVAWAAGSLQAGSREKGEALSVLFKSLKSIATECDCTFIYGVTGIAAYMKIMEGWGMIPVETNMNSYVMPLKGDSIEFLKD